MRSLTSAIRPRRRRSINEEGTGRQRSMGKLGEADSPGASMGRSRTEGSNAVNAGGGLDSFAGGGSLWGHARLLHESIEEEPDNEAEDDEGREQAPPCYSHMPQHVFGEAQGRRESTESAGGSSGLFGGDSSLLKRVSSVPGNLSLFRAHLTEPLRQPEFRAAPRYTRDQTVQLAAHEADDTPMYGYALLGLTSVLFVTSMYSLVVSKYMPYTGIAFLDAVKDDRYFCLLMPITGLSFAFAVFWNWLGMKFFRHS
ncbi:hypothetical protein GGF46_000380 [Coemansia sp. RSA 552]|nr:hypothetical protein GGF46_000380 [Coemansia sp. RSA 552]